MLDDTEWARPDVSDEFLGALGAVTYWSGRVEGRLFWLGASLIDGWYDGYGDPDDLALAATRGLGFDALRQLIVRVLDLRGSASHPEFRKTLKEAEHLMRERNRYIHGEWWPDEGEPDLSVTHRSWRGVEASEVPVAELRNLASKLASVSERIERAQGDLHRQAAKTKSVIK
jgi:hypothetical protein